MLQIKYTVSGQSPIFGEIVLCKDWSYSNTSQSDDRKKKLLCKINKHIFRYAQNLEKKMEKWKW